MELAETYTGTVSRPTPRWRVNAFRVLAALYVLIGLFMLEGVTEGLMPWTTVGCPGCVGDYNPEVHRWHGAEHGAMIAILFSGSMLALLMKPRERPLLLQFYVLGFAILNAVFASFMYQDFTSMEPGATVGFAVALSLLVVAYPWFSSFASFRRKLRPSLPMLALTIVSALLLAPQIWQDLQRQIDGTAADEHAAAGRWAESVIVMLVLIAAGLLASSRRPGWTVLGTLLGIAYLYLGVAALTVPDQPGSWGVLGGVATLAGGAAYLGLTYRESRASLPAYELEGREYLTAA